MIALSPKVKRLFPLVFAVLLGLVAVWLNVQYLTRQRQVLEAERKKVQAQYQTPIDVIVAAQDLAEDTALEAQHLRSAVIPEKFVQPYAVRAQEGGQLLGRVTVAPVAEGEQILKTKVRRPEEMPTASILSRMTPKGKRAVTIAVDTLTGVGGFVRPGDLVDILWTLQLPAQPGQKDGQVVTLTLFQDVPVLAVGRETSVSKKPAAAPDAQPGGEKKPAVAEEAGAFTVTIALTPQETSFLLFAREQGRIQLSLRPATETGSRVAVTPANINTLMEAVLGVPQQSQQPQEPQVKPPRSVEVYKGLQKDVVILAEQEP